MARLVMRNASGFSERIVRVLSATKESLIGLDDNDGDLSAEYTDRGNGIRVTLATSLLEAKTSLIGVVEIADDFTEPVNVWNGKETTTHTTSNALFTDLADNNEILAMELTEYGMTVQTLTGKFLLINLAPLDVSIAIKAKVEDFKYLGPKDAVSTGTDLESIGFGFKPPSYADKVAVKASIAIKGAVAFEIGGVVIPYAIQPGFIDEFFTEFTEYGIKAKQVEVSDGTGFYTYEFENMGIAPRSIRVVLLDSDSKFTLMDFVPLNNYNTVAGITVGPTIVADQEPLVNFAGVIELNGDGPYHVSDGTTITEFFTENDLINYLNDAGYKVTIVEDGSTF